MTAPAPMSAPQRSTVGGVATGALSAVAIVAGCGSFYLSMLFAMASDACSTSKCGGDGVLGLAYLITWGGVAAAMWLTFSGIGRASRHGRATWLWPAAGLLLIIATFIAGLMVANSLFTHH
jgi:hypothetical protein